jgi:hypothetical protein
MLVGEVAIEGTPGDISFYADLLNTGVFDTLVPKKPVGSSSMRVRISCLRFSRRPRGASAVSMKFP